MDMMQRSRLDRYASEQAKPGPGISPRLVAAAIAVAVAGAFAWSPVLGGVAAIGGVSLMLAWWVRGTEENGEEVEARSEAPELRAPAANLQGAFVALGNRAPIKTNRPEPPKAPEQAPIEPPPPPEPVETPASSFQLFVREGPAAVTKNEHAKLAKLIALTTERFTPLEPLLAARLHKNRQQELQNFLMVKDILAALHRRHSELEQTRAALDIPRQPDDPVLRHAWELCFGSLEIQRDPLSSITQEAASERLTIAECESKLDTIFQQFMRRKTFYQALYPPQL